jgi:hypothetical protein
MFVIFVTEGKNRQAKIRDYVCFVFFETKNYLETLQPTNHEMLSKFWFRQSEIISLTFAANQNEFDMLLVRI